jgi:aspartate aminotransferase-like enzyme
MNLNPSGLATRDLVPPGYRLRIPGPAAVPERVRAALALPVISHRGCEFHALLTKTTSELRSVFGTRGDIFVLGASGTGAMEAALVNVLTPGDAVLILLNGQFSERFAAMAEGMGARVDRLETAWGEAPDPELVAERAKARPYRAVVCVHNESSTGVVADIAAIGAALRGLETLLIVDSVSGAGGMEMRMDEWGIDILVAASQKALMCPPGLAFVAASERAMQVIASAAAVPRFYFDLRKAKASLDKGETPFTPPVSLVLALREALAMMAEEGLSNVFARHLRLAAALRAGCEALGLKVFPAAHVLSPTVTVLALPDGYDASAIVRHMHRRYRTVIAGQRTRLSGRVIRFGTMGFVGPDDIVTDVEHLEATLRDLGYASIAAAGVRAAKAALVR